MFWTVLGCNALAAVVGFIVGVTFRATVIEKEDDGE